KTLGILYEFPEDMIKSKAYLDPANFYLPNPNLGLSVSQEWLEDNLRKNQAKQDGAFQQFLAKHLNVEIGLGLRSDRWAGADFWEGAVDRSLTLEALMARSEVAVVGIDGGGLDDLLGLCVLGRDRETRRWLHWGHAWAHEIVLERRKDVAPKLRDFERDGDLTLVESPGDDVVAVADVVCRIKAAGLLPDKHAIGVDAAGIGDIVDELTSPERGITLEQIVAVAQGWKLNAAIKTTERQVAGGKLVHGARP